MTEANGAVSEAAFQRAVLDLAKRCGWLTFHVNDSRRQVSGGVLVGDKDAAGFPDLLMVRNRQMLVAELKSAKGRLTAQQRFWLESIVDCTEIRAEVWRPDAWPAIERTLKARA